MTGLPKDETVIVPAVVSGRLAGMLQRRGFRLAPWYDPALQLIDNGAMIREAVK